MRVLFVCLGNICRSPAAEGIFRAKAENAGLAVEIQSAGTDSYHAGELPDSRMREAAKNRGYHLTSKAQTFKPSHFKSFDWIITMDDRNLERVLFLASDKVAREKVLRFVDCLTSHDVDEVPDPYYGGPEGFDLVINILEDGCDQLVKKFRVAGHE